MLCHRGYGFKTPIAPFGAFVFAFTMWQLSTTASMIKLPLLLLLSVSLAAPMASSAPPDAFALWQTGALRGANVMQAQCTVEDLRVLRAWGANLAEIPVSNVYAPTPPYGFQPENLAKLDQAVKAAEQAGLYVALTCREGPGRPDFERSHEIWRDGSAQEAYAKMWREIASHYHGRPSIAGYDLMCEPHPDGEASQPLGDWNVLAQHHHVPIFVGEFGCARYAPGAPEWLRDQMDLYEKYGWSWAYWAFREWDVMNLERSADPADKVNHSDTPLLRLFKTYFAKDGQFLNGN
jgi:hypothetical protein